MASENTLTTSDEGKQVVTHDNEVVGQIVSVAEHSAEVNPDTDLSDTMMSRLGWSDHEETYQLEFDEIDAVVDDQVRLKSS
jgi:cell shape-determining protein MreC